MTKYEKQIYDIVNASHEHMTADQIYGELQNIYPAVARATVYNNLKKLCDEKLIRRVPMEDSPDRYDRIEKHDHLVCQKCGKLSDVRFDDLTPAFQKQFGDTFVSYDLKIFYICPDCRTEPSSHLSVCCTAAAHKKPL